MEGLGGVLMWAERRVGWRQSSLAPEPAPGDRHGADSCEQEARRFRSGAHDGCLKYQSGHLPDRPKWHEYGFGHKDGIRPDGVVSLNRQSKVGVATRNPIVDDGSNVPMPGGSVILPV